MRKQAEYMCASYIDTNIYPCTVVLFGSRSGPLEELHHIHVQPNADSIKHTDAP